jgi:hypothetical protein
VLAGRWRDAQVASHILVGTALGAALFTFIQLRESLTAGAEGLDTFSGLYYEQGTRYWISGVAAHTAEGITAGLTIFFLLFCFRVVLRKDWIAAIVAGLAFTALQSDLANSVNWQAEYAALAVAITALLFALLRFGLLVTVAAVFAINTFGNLGLGTDLNVWYAPFGLATIALLLAVAAVAFRYTLGERELV